jgi:hypothetical protein
MAGALGEAGHVDPLKGVWRGDQADTRTGDAADQRRVVGQQVGARRQVAGRLPGISARISPSTLPVCRPF